MIAITQARRCILATVVAVGFFLAITGGTVRAADRTIQIRMVDAKTGHPIATSEFQVWIGSSESSAQTSGISPRWIKPSKEGIGEIELTASAGVITVHAQYGKAMWSYINCDGLRDRGPYREHWYSISEVLASGKTAPNFCGKQKIIAKPGEFIFFVRPMTAWEKMHQ